ncbi:retrovirus-related pol polyprotein from transposon TNT 1-94 [Tanacetum coccineum]
MSRTMLNEQSLPQKFWCNAVDTSTYILNRILIRAILGKTPYELLREPKNVNEALRDESWIVAMQEELNQFVANDVWELVPQSRNMANIGTKWVFRNKLDENDVISQNKARLVAQGYNQQEDIDYDETYAPVARLESIRILLAYACALDFKLFQMDVKSAFLNGFINEEKFGLEDSKPMKTPMSSDTKVTKDEECESIDSTKYRVMIDGNLMSWYMVPLQKFHIKPTSLLPMTSSLIFEKIEKVKSLASDIRKKLSENPELSNESYVLYDRVMNHFGAQKERKTRKDLGTIRGRYSTSSYSTFGQPSSFHFNDDDDGNDEGTSRASTPSPIRYVNSLTNEVP